jgi:hypothetical protein
MEAQKEVTPSPSPKRQKVVNSKRPEIHNIFVSITFIVFLINKKTKNSPNYTHQLNKTHDKIKPHYSLPVT